MLDRLRKYLSAKPLGLRRIMELRVDRTGPYAIAWISGEIRSEDAQAFARELHPLVGEKGSKLAIDLSQVTWLDSSGLTCLINVVTRGRLSQGRVILVSPASFVAGVFEVTQLDRWFEIVANHEAAARQLGASDN